jgi:pimeloyl-ACP methyl ester carboxylesterase
MATFILVHGAWHGGWCWEKLVPILEARGHRALAPDLAGMGADHRPTGDDVLATWADDIAALASAQSEKVVLVGHSRGGIVISEVAERVPDRIRLLVYLTAFMLPSGESLVTGRDWAEGGPDLSRLLAFTEDGRASIIAGEDSAAVFYNQVDPALLPAITARLCPEPNAALAQPLNLTPERYGRVRRAYVEATEDNAIIPALQREFIRRSPCDRVVSLPSDHSPFYSMPERLADALEELAAA